MALQQQSRRGNRSNNNCAGNNPEIRGHERTTRRCHASGGDEATPFLVAATDIYNEGDAIHTANRKNSGIKSDAKAIATAAALAINHKDNRKRNMRRSTRRAGTLQELPQFRKVAIAARETINGGENKGGDICTGNHADGVCANIKRNNSCTATNGNSGGNNN